MITTSLVKSDAGLLPEAGPLPHLLLPVPGLVDLLPLLLVLEEGKYSEKIFR